MDNLNSFLSLNILSLSLAQSLLDPRDIILYDSVDKLNVSTVACGGRRRTHRVLY